MKAIISDITAYNLLKVTTNKYMRKMLVTFLYIDLDYFSRIIGYLLFNIMIKTIFSQMKT